MNQEANVASVSNIPTPEELAAAEEMVARLKAAQGAPAATETPDLADPQTEPAQEEPANTSTPAQETVPAQPAPETIPTDVVAKLTAQFNAAMNNPAFFRNPKRAKRLGEALVVPMFDDRSMQQFAISAREELIEVAMKAAIKNHTVPVMPTDEEIAVLAKEKFEAKKAKDAAKAAKKAA